MHDKLSFVKKLSAILVLCLASSILKAQGFTVTGAIVDSTTHNPIVGVNVTVTSKKDTAYKRYSVTDLKGEFFFSSLRQEAYVLIASYVGYVDTKRTVVIKSKSERVGRLSMLQKPVELRAVEVVGEPVPVEQKKDTVQFNAGAFKSNPDASAEDMITKMPGITVDKSTVKAQGENVQQVLVDGRPFFGDDPFIALRNLPADMIDKIQVYDKLSDQAELTGFDDGQTIKTMNVITRPDKRNGQFGKVYGGYGDQDKFEAGGNTNVFNGTRRISLIELSNNVNQQNFSTQDLLGVLGNAPRLGTGFGAGFRGGGSGGGGGRGGRGGGAGGGFLPFQNTFSDFIVGQQNGISTTHSAGLNYSDMWLQNMNVTGSYFLNLSNNQNEQLVNRQYLLAADTNQFYDENNLSANKNYNHRINLRMEYTMDSSNALIFNPKVSFQNTNSSSGLSGSTVFGESTLLDQTQTNNQSATSGYNISDAFTYRHKFSAQGRTLALSVNTALNNKNSNGNLNSLTQYYNDSTAVGDTINQRTTASSPAYSVSSNIMYTEPLWENNLLQWNYNVSFSKNIADKRAYDFDPSDESYDLLNARLSNSLDNNYTTQHAGFGYRRRGTNYNIMLNVSYQRAVLAADYSFPAVRNFQKDFYGWLPSAMLNFRFSQASNLRVMYRTSTTPPSVSMLQNVVDNTNPTQLTVGNADLKQNYNHSFTARYSYTNVENSQTFFALVSGSITNNYITSATFIFPNDTTLPGNLVLKQGVQLSEPVNIDGYRVLNSFLAYGLPIGFFRSNLNLNAGLTYTRAPGIINGGLNTASTYGVSQGVVVGSNISQDVDFTLSYNYSLNYARNTLQPQLNNNYCQHTAQFKFNFIVWEGIVLRNDMSHQLYAGYGSAFNQSYILWNAGLGKKFLKDQSLEVALSAFDLLNQNSKIIRNVTSAYIEDVQPQVITGYLLLTVTYTMRNFQL